MCTATSEKEYFFFPGENPALECREQVWRSLVSDGLSFALVSCKGVVTFSAGPFKSGREDRHGRPIVNSVIVQTSDPEDKARMGRIFSAMLASVEARRDFAEQLEARAVQRVLKGEAWDGQLPEIAGVSVADAGLPDFPTQQVYPADSSATGDWAGKISALLKSGRDFAVGRSVFSGGEVARKLYSVYKFGFDDWSSTFIAVFSAAASSQSPLRCPAPPAKVPPSPNGFGGPLAIVVAVVFLLGAVVTCSKLTREAPSEQKTGTEKKGIGKKNPAEIQNMPKEETRGE